MIGEPEIGFSDTWNQPRNGFIKGKLLEQWFSSFLAYWMIFLSSAAPLTILLSLWKIIKYGKKKWKESLFNYLLIKPISPQHFHKTRNPVSFDYPISIIHHYYLPPFNLDIRKTLTALLYHSFSYMIKYILNSLLSYFFGIIWI